MKKWLLAAFVFSVPIQARFVLVSWTQPFNEWTSAFLWGTDLLLALLVILNFKFLILNKFSIPKGANIFLFLFFATAGISVSAALIPAVSWYRLLKLLEYAVLFVVMRSVFRDEGVKSLAIKALVISALFQSLIGIGQYALQSDLGLRWLGESALDPMGQAVAVVTVDSHSYLRAYGTTPHPNILAVWLMLGIWGLWAWRHAYWQAGSKWFAVANALILFTFFLTFSRTVIAAWVLYSIFIIFKHRKIPKDLAVTTILTGAVFISLFWPQVKSRLQISSGDEAVAQRIFYQEFVFEDFKTIGIGQFVPVLMKKLPIYPGFIYQPAHSMFLLILDEIGVLGLLFFVLFLLFGVRFSPVVLALILLSFFDHYFWTLQQGGLIWWGLLAFYANGRINTA